MIIYISKKAKKNFIQLLKKQKKGTKIRVFINNAGKKNAECGVVYCGPTEIKKTDFEIKFSKFSIIIDNISAPFLENAEIDFIKNEFGEELTLKVPNKKYSEISDDATLVDKINYFIDNKINPYLATHGGNVNLIKLTNDNHAILQFQGGCNGCSMANITLKEGIEKELLKNFPELKGVKDITEHKRGKHSYY